MTIEKASNQEDEYFARENAERLRKLHAEEQARLKQSEQDALRKKPACRCARTSRARACPARRCWRRPRSRTVSSSSFPGSSSERRSVAALADLRRARRALGGARGAARVLPRAGESAGRKDPCLSAA